MNMLPGKQDRNSRSRIQSRKGLVVASPTPTRALSLVRPGSVLMTLPVSHPDELVKYISRGEQPLRDCKQDTVKCRGNVYQIDSLAQ